MELWSTPQILLLFSWQSLLEILWSIVHSTSLWRYVCVKILLDLTLDHFAMSSCKHCKKHFLLTALPEKIYHYFYHVCRDCFDIYIFVKVFFFPINIWIMTHWISRKYIYMYMYMHCIYIYFVFVLVVEVQRKN